MRIIKFAVSNHAFTLFIKLPLATPNINMQEPGNIEKLTESISNLINIRFELLKLEATERSSDIGSNLVSQLIIGLLGFSMVFFLSLFAGFWFSARMNDSYSGFAIVSGFYFLLLLICILFRKKIIVEPLREKIIEKIVPLIK